MANGGGGMLRVGSFNVENLFSRARVFNEDDQAIGSEILDKIAEIQRLLEEDPYRKSVIVDWYNDAGLDPYISIRCTRVAEGDHGKGIPPIVICQCAVARRVVAP